MLSPLKNVLEFTKEWSNLHESWKSFFHFQKSSEKSRGHGQEKRKKTNCPSPQEFCESSNIPEWHGVAANHLWLLSLDPGVVHLLQKLPALPSGRKVSSCRRQNQPTGHLWPTDHGLPSCPMEDTRSWFCSPSEVTETRVNEEEPVTVIWVYPFLGTPRGKEKVVHIPPPRRAATEKERAHWPQKQSTHSPSIILHLRIIIRTPDKKKNTLGENNQGFLRGEEDQDKHH